MFMLGVAEITASAQRRGYRVSRPVIIRSHWGWNNGFWGRGWGYDPFYDPYFYDPYLREQRDRYYKQKDVSDARKKVAKNREKYLKDGYIDPKEQEKLMDDQRKYAEKVAKLDKFNRDHN
ncbi:MAG TPA: hypothetical protein VGO43_09165 [Pyrinomonadaceae bacterium]|nr:hypothetical protein [Pyrinomonadaceae bacterium]